MKKKSVWLFAVLSFVLPLVSAASYFDLRSGFERVIDEIEGIGTPIFEVLLNTSSGEFFFAKVLILLLLFMVLVTILKRVPLFERNYTLAALVAGIISILSLRYLPSEDFFMAMLLPYSTLGIALTVFLPFLIYFFFVHQSVPGTFGRRAAWFLFGAVFLVLWALRGSELGDASWIYILGLVFVIFSFLFDSTIHSYFGLHELSSFAARNTRARVASLQEELNRLSHAPRSSAIDGRMRDIVAELRRLHANT